MGRQEGLMKCIQFRIYKFCFIPCYKTLTNGFSQRLNAIFFLIFVFRNLDMVPTLCHNFFRLRRHFGVIFYSIMI